MSNDFKLTLWCRTVKRQDGTEFTSFSNTAPFNGVDCWWNGYRKTVTKKDGTEVEVIELTVKPKAPLASSAKDSPF